MTKIYWYAVVMAGGSIIVMAQEGETVIKTGKWHFHNRYMSIFAGKGNGKTMSQHCQ